MASFSDIVKHFKKQLDIFVNFLKMLPIDNEPNTSKVMEYKETLKGFHIICLACKTRDLYWHHDMATSYIDFMRVALKRCVNCGYFMYRKRKPITEMDLEVRRWLLEEAYKTPPKNP